MPQGVIATIPKFQFSANGVPMVGGTLDTYIAGTTTPTTTWQDSALSTANTNPIVLDARGECVLWLDPAVVYKFVLKNAPANGGVVQWTQDNISNPAALRIDLSASSGASLVGYLPAGTGAVATTAQAKLRESVSVKDFGAVGDGATDDTAAIQAACTASRRVFFPTPSAYYKITAAITLLGGAHLIGAGQTQTIIGAWGCDAFLINGANGDHVTIEGMELRGYSGAGVVDAKTNTGVKAFGLTGAHVNFLKIKSCYLRGWLYCVDWQYTWNSTLDDVDTINCTNGVRLFGQSVNNSIAKCRLLANTGNASILTTKDGAVQGEGLMITGTLIASGAFGIQSDGFLVMTVVNCVIDLITDTAFDFTQVQAFSVSSNWIYAANYCFDIKTSAAPITLGASIANNYMRVTAASGKVVYVGGNIIGITISGGEASCTTTGRLVHVDGSSVSVIGVYGVNTGAYSSYYFNGVDCFARNCTGSTTVQWAIGIPSQGLTPVAHCVFPGTTGTTTVANNCYVVRNGTGDYTVMFDFALASAAYIPLITMDRGGNGAMGYTLTSQLAGSFRFACTNQTAALQDPPTVSVLVFN